MTAGSKRRGRATEQEWLQRSWDEAKRQTEEAWEMWVAQVAHVTAPPGAKRTLQQKNAEDVLTEYES